MSEHLFSDDILFAVSYNPETDNVKVVGNENELFTSPREQMIISSTLASELGKRLAKSGDNLGKSYAALGITINNIIKSFNSELEGGIMD